VLDGAGASEEAFRRLAPRYSYLHVATHGFFAPPEIKSLLERPEHGQSKLLGDFVTKQSIAGFHPGLLSGLALAGASNPNPEGDDGILTAQEVSTLDLRGVKLVVLSACETGLGEVAGGEGLLGLQRSFQAAGARSVIASLWKVDDLVTRDLMKRFYDNLWNKGLSKIEALREAQLWLLRERGPRGLIAVEDETKQTNRLPPFYWAAFTLSGDWR
jgi:CHAT domain-containing protein